MMPDREEQLSRYIDYLNQERRPPRPVEEGHQDWEDWQELLTAARLAKSLRDPAMPEADFPRQMAGRLARLLGTRNQNARSRPRAWWWLGGAAAVIALLFLSWNVLAQFNWFSGAAPEVALQAQDTLRAGSPADPPAEGPEDGRARALAPERELKAPGEEAAAAQENGEAQGGAVTGSGLSWWLSAEAVAGPEAGSQAEGEPVTGQSQGETAVPAKTGSKDAPASGPDNAGGAAAKATAADLSHSKNPPASAAMAPPPSRDSQPEKVERPGKSSRSLKAETVPAPGLQVEISLDKAALQQPGRFSVRLANTTAGGLSLNFPTPILVIKEVGTGEAGWKAALALNLPLLLSAGQEVTVATTWPGPERPGWYAASVEGINATATGSEAVDSVPLQDQPLEFFVPYPEGKIRAAGELQLPARAVKGEAAVTVEKVIFTPDSTLVTLAVQAPGLNTPLDLQVTAAWDAGPAELPRQVAQEAGSGSVRISAWFNPTPATAGRLHLVLVAKDPPASVGGEPWSLDIPLGPKPAQPEMPPEEPADSSSVPEDVYGEEESLSAPK